MAEIDQNVGEEEVVHAEDQGYDPAEGHGEDPSLDHAAEHTEDQGYDPATAHGYDPSTEHGYDPSAEHSYDPNAEHGYDPNAEQGYDPNSEQGYDSNAEQGYDPNAEEGYDPNTEHGYDPTTDGGLDHATDHDMEQPDEHLEGNATEHDEDPSLGEAPEDSLIEKGNNGDNVAGGGEKRWPGWPGESVFRMLVPAQKVGSIIGRKGEFIKKIVEETRARIKILDGPPGTSERAVMVSGKEDPDSDLPPAMDGLLRVHKRIVDGLDNDSSHAPPSTGAKVSTRLLVPASQAGSLIGKQGGTVKSIQEASSCVVRVLGADDLPVFALQEDRVVEVLGEAAGVHKAIELIASHLRKFLVDRSVIPLFEMHMQMPNPQMEQHMPPHQSWGPPQGPPPNASGSHLYGHNPQYMAPPPRQMDNYYPTSDLPPPMEKQPHQGISAYGREPPMGVHGSTNAQAAPSMITQQMQIPLSYADAVIGNAGASISYIRRASGATVVIQETRGVPGEMTVEISGSASQVQTAQQLIQNFMAEVPTQAQTGVSADQAYSSYAASHSSVYASPPSNQGHAGGYGSVYGSNYGY